MALVSDLISQAFEDLALIEPSKEVAAVVLNDLLSNWALDLKGVSDVAGL